MKRVALVVLMVLAGCSGVSQTEYDELENRLSEARDDLAVRERADADQVTADAVVGAYVKAYESLELELLNGVYAEGLVAFDAARGITFRSRRNAIADLESGIEAFGIETQEALEVVVRPGTAIIEWEMRGSVRGVGWSLPGVSVLTLDGALIVEETLYYNLADAPWGP